MLPTIDAAARDVRQGRLSPLDLLGRCLEAIDRYEGRVRAWVSVDGEGARAEAERRTAELKAGRYRGPLHGIPVGIKDIFDVFDWPTAAGSKRWAQSIARQDSTAVWRLREAGAVLLGKTVTTQYASFDPPPTRNPWDLRRTPGGSSSGSAAALACGMCLGALGSQTGGSITRPASFCGVAGLKPTYGRVSCAGVVPLAASMDHPGPMARCVRDLAILLQVIAGPDPLDPVRAGANVPVPDYLARLQHPTPPRLGRVRGLFDDLAEPVIRALMDAVAERLQAGGAVLRDVALPAAFSDVLPRHQVVMAVEAAAFHGARLRRYPEDYGPRIRGLLEQGLSCPAPEYAGCKEHQQQLSRDVLSYFEGLDTLLAPATRGPAPAADTTGDPAFNSPWSYTGPPGRTRPALARGRAAGGGGLV
jgi:aspartyl-tRNA(Asn)/glutamyl-tRNA(Gln) amidotransferase subunit A